MEDEDEGKSKGPLKFSKKSKGSADAPQQSPRTSGPKTSPKKKKHKKNPTGKELVRLPPCGHAWCLGEVLKKAGIEPGVCWPRPLPWALTGKLRYLPGWEQQCRNYKLNKVYYMVKPKRKNQDREQYQNELREAKLLWSYLRPALVYPKRLTYSDPEPGVVCDCLSGTCKRDDQCEPEES